MTDPIEAMARQVERVIFRRVLSKRVEGYTLEMANEITTAALQALRDTLVPVGYWHTSDGYDQYLTSYRMTPEEGWTETPLYALPEIKP